MQAGLKIPFDPLLMDFLRKTKLYFGQITPNTLRIILGIAELNMHYELGLDFHDIRYYNNLGVNKNDKRWNLRLGSTLPLWSKLHQIPINICMAT